MDVDKEREQLVLTPEEQALIKRRDEARYPIEQAGFLMSLVQNTLDRIIDTDLSELPHGAERNTLIHRKEQTLNILHGMSVVLRPYVDQQIDAELEQMLKGSGNS